MAAVSGGQPQKTPFVVIAAQVAVAEAFALRTPLNIFAVFTIVKHHFSVVGENSEGQRVIIKMAVFNFSFRGSAPAAPAAHRHSWRSGGGRRAVLGIKQLIQLFAGLLPAITLAIPSGAGEQDKQQRQAQAQAQTGESFHASPGYSRCRARCG